MANYYKGYTLSPYSGMIPPRGGGVVTDPFNKHTSSRIGTDGKTYYDTTNRIFDFTTPTQGYSDELIPMDSYVTASGLSDQNVYAGGRSLLDNIYGLSTDKRFQINTPNVARMKNANEMGLLKNRKFSKRNFSSLNQASPYLARTNQPMQEMANVRKVQPQGFSSLGEQLNAMGITPTKAQGNVRQDATPPNFKNNLLDYVISPEGQGFAQGLLEASGYSTMPKTMGEALALASKRSGEAVDTEFKKEQQKFLNLMKEKELGLKEGEFGLKEKKAEREEIVFDRAILKDDKSKEIFDSLNKDDYTNDKEYYAAAAKKLLNEGFIAEGTKLAELGKPTTIKDFTKEIMSANKDEKVTFNATKKGIDNFRQILDAAESQSGEGAYALMIKFIKQLDDSVVREGEVRSFEAFQGLYKSLKIKVEKFQGQGFPPSVKTEIVNLANKTVNRLVQDYETYKEDRSDNLYTPLGIPPSIVFAGYNLNTEGLNLTKEYQVEEFSQDNLQFRKDLRNLDTSQLGSVDISNYTQNQKEFYNNLLDQRLKELENK